MKAYHCYRTHETTWVRGTPHCEVLDLTTGERYALPPARQHGMGFEWGYMGTGPTKLALSIYQDFLGRPLTQVSLWPYQELKATFLAPMPLEGGMITEAHIRVWRRTAVVPRQPGLPYTDLDEGIVCPHCGKRYVPAEEWPTDHRVLDCEFCGAPQPACTWSVCCPEMEELC
jgi:Family of unknown function (DUF6166)